MKLVFCGQFLWVFMKSGSLSQMLNSNFVKRVLAKLDLISADRKDGFIKSLIEERDFFYTVFDGMVEAVIISDKDNDIRYVNHTACVLLGRSAESFRSKTIFEVLSDPVLREFVEGSILNRERIRNKDIFVSFPSERYLNVNIYPLLKRGGEQGHVVIFMDVSGKKMEEQVKQRAESVVALSAVTAGIAHEIKNPLGAIDIHLQLLEHDVEKDSIERQKVEKRLAVIRAEVSRLNGIVVDFLSAIRPMQPHLQMANFNELVKEVTTYLTPEFDAHDMNLIINLDDSIAEAFFDPKLLRQVLMNLFKNSLEAMSKKGEVSICTKREGEMLLVKVKDNGCGISKDRLNAIFEPYQTTKDFGTGLGLTIVYRIIKEHGGTIVVNSRKGSWTEFKFSIPLYPEKQKLLL